MLIECGSCEMRGKECDGCVVTAFLGVPAGTEVEIEIDDGELRALDVLADVGMVPPLRLSVPRPRAS
jgi:hypothetical protein